MKNSKQFFSILFTMLVLACVQMGINAQTADDKTRIATIAAFGSSVRWDVSTPNAGLSITIAAPDGRVFRQESKSGTSAEFTLSDKQGNRLPDGIYTYELRLTPAISAGAKEELALARGKDDEPESVRAARKRAVLPGLVQSGSFSILNGAVIVAGSAEETGARRVGKTAEQFLPVPSRDNATTKSELHHPLLFKPDDVIPDDLIVQGSACVGLDCVNGEVFGFDTIRLKENNTRLQFEDTSAAGFPLNNWQIRANSSAAGGASFLGFVDQGAAGNSETGTIVFEVDAGAPANALKVSSNGKVGLRTATPGLDLHIMTSDTPAHRLEQTNAGGFTAQTWDIAGNEANFFVRDVTGGSRLPFRIRPGAPTSSIDISATGAVGIGTGTPGAKLDILDNSTGVAGMQVRNTTSGAGAQIQNKLVNDAGSFSYYGLTSSGYTDAPILANRAFFGSNAVDTVIWAQSANNIIFATNGIALSSERMRVTSTGNVGIGTTAPTETLSVNGTASKTGGGSWAVFSDERLKNIKGNFNIGLKAVMQLQPLRYEYKPTNALNLESKGEHIGFGAQALQKVIPEAVTTSDSGYLQVNNDPIIWTMLNAIKEQQKEIEQLKEEVNHLRAVARKRR
ncbi:MAG TPA: tail fiber domain-containing protein [Pyrinomonadaceae bacterium]|jgi:hypothetical protein|nr:tail fiber domain-containing protein [Pyrinomonadaceae bacterium]